MISAVDRSTIFDLPGIAGGETWKMISCPASKNVGLPVKVGRTDLSKNGIARLQRIRMKRRCAAGNKLRERQRENWWLQKSACAALKHRRAKLATLQTQPYLLPNHQTNRWQLTRMSDHPLTGHESQALRLPWKTPLMPSRAAAAECDGVVRCIDVASLFPSCQEFGRLEGRSGGAQRGGWECADTLRG